MYLFCNSYSWIENKLAVLFEIRLLQFRKVRWWITGAISVFGHSTLPCPWTPTTTLKKVIQHSLAYYKIPNTKFDSGKFMLPEGWAYSRRFVCLKWPFIPIWSDVCPLSQDSNNVARGTIGNCSFSLMSFILNYCPVRTSVRYSCPGHNFETTSVINMKLCR
jgi:hypothetical protein